MNKQFAPMFSVEPLRIRPGDVKSSIFTEIFLSQGVNLAITEPSYRNESYDSVSLYKRRRTT